MSKVFVLNADKTPLNPVHPGQARLLLTQGRAAVFRHYPFTIILKEEVHDAQIEPLRLKIDPGSKTTGLAVVNDATGEVVWAAELTHRGQAIKARLDARRAIRRGRRTRKTRHRAPRFLNRRRPDDWLPPSLESRVANVTTWVARLRRLCPIAALSMELVKFDTHLMQDPDIGGVAYQQGELAGYEVREYLLEKWGRRCAYCGATGVPLHVEHIVPRSRHGSDRVSNLCIACEPCNQAKGSRTAAECGHPEVQAKAKAPLKDAAAVNATRWALFHRLAGSGLPLETGTGGRTKFNRTQQALSKTHWLDAACVGASTPLLLHVERISPLLIAARGHGNRQMCATDRYGFPKRERVRCKSYLGFRTGDLVRAVVPAGKFAGTHVGCVTIRQRPSFRINGHDVHPRHCTHLQQGDGYAYTT
jgi:5-methylcytosine-specific restriction endonuclease McrA